MHQRVLARGDVTAVILGGGLRVFVSLALAGCGSKESPPRPDETPPAEAAAPNDEASAKPKTGDGRARRNARNPRGTTRDEQTRRSRRSARLREWTLQHLYMHLTIDHLELSEEQLAKLADMNWRHFETLQKKEAERPPLDEALLKMLTTGTLDEQAFEKDRTWLTAHEALLKAQYQERMTTLHTTLTGKQRAKLVGLVEATQKNRYAEEDKRVASKAKARPPEGCGGLGNRFIGRFVSRRDLTKEQRGKLDKLRAELDKENPSAEKLEDHRRALRIFDLVERKSFVQKTFDASKMTRPSLAYAEPATVSQCNQRELQALLGMLSAQQRQDAAARLQKNAARRRGDDPNAAAVDGGAL
jgi:predicted small lipoprotein YifL